MTLAGLGVSKRSLARREAPLSLRVRGVMGVWDMDGEMCIVVLDPFCLLR